MAETSNTIRGVRKQRRGIVISRSGDKSIVVRVESRKLHPVYGKVIRQSRKFHAHDEKNEAKVGDRVAIVEIRPVSKMKNWRLFEIIERGVLKATETEVE